LNVSGLKWKDINFELKNHKIGKEEILVSKMEQKETKPQFQLNLKVARILGIKEHPNADKLYVLDIDLGNEKRQLVAGIKGYYSADELKNKKIVVITNLKHAKLRGVESQGMLLAGDDGSGPGLLTVERSNAGDKVYFDGFEIGNEQVTYEEFAKISMIVKNSKVTFEGKELKTDKEIVKVERTKDGGRVR
jgi:methionine--tRNA ligase beta chain